MLEAAEAVCCSDFNCLFSALLTEHCIFKLFQIFKQQATILVAKGHKLHPAVPGNFIFDRYKLFQNCVEVTASKAKSTHTGPTGIIAGCDPGPQVCIYVKGGMLYLQFWINFIGLKGREQHLVMQGQCGFDQAGGSGCRFCMSYVRFNRSQSTSCAAFRKIVCKNFAKSFELNLVTNPGTCTVCFHHFNGIGIDSRPPVGPPEGSCLTLAARGINSVRFPVARRTNALDNSVDPIFIVYGFIQAFQHQQTNAFA